MVPLPPLRDGGCALPICPFGRACLPLISDAPDCKCSPGRLWFLGGVGEMPESRCTDFNPRALCGARPDRRPCRPDDGGISIHAPRVGRDRFLPPSQAPAPISIHAPRVGRDLIIFVLTGLDVDFNPRAPCGARPLASSCVAWSPLFQSTRPVWGATFEGVPSSFFFG